MAKFLWVGSTAGAYVANAGTTAWIASNIVDQYNFNKSGNWYVSSIINGTYRWGATSGTPSNGDTVIFGGESSVTTPTGFYNNTESFGWTAAKSPCLFGGFSGGVGSGSWSNTSGVASGTTFTTPLNYIIGNMGAYTFPYLGGGITGDVANWCALRDGVSAGWHTLQYSSGIRDPQQNLKLKWKTYNSFTNTKTLNGFPVDAAGVSYTNTFIYDFDAVKAIVQVGSTGATGATANSGLVQNILSFTSRGAGLRVRNGSIGTVILNSGSIGPWNYPEQIQLSPYGTYNDCGIELYNSIIGSLDVYKWQATYVRGCTLGLVNVYPVAYGVSNVVPTYTSQVPLEFVSNINALATFNDLYGGVGFTTGDITSSYNKMNLVYTPITVRVNNQPDTVTSITSQSQGTKQTVIIGDRGGVVPVTIPTINIQSGILSQGATAYETFGTFSYMPWAVEFAGSATVTTINNINGYIYTNDSIDVDATLKLSEIYLSSVGTVDFGQKKALFDNWLIGGLCASTGQIDGGIIFNDESGRVLGSQGLRLWNTQSKVFNTINARIAGAPKSTTPGNIIA